MKKARDLILKLYKENNITKKQCDTLLDAIENRNWHYNPPTYQPYIDWTFIPYEQPKWTITCNSDNTNVE